MFEDEVYPEPDHTPNVPPWLADISCLDLAMISGVLAVLLIVGLFALAMLVPEYTAPATDCLNAVCV